MSESYLTRLRRDGYAILPGFWSKHTTRALRERTTELLAQMNLSKDLELSLDPSSLYFLDSGDRIRAFFEADATPSDPRVNKLGHALHELDPDFRSAMNEPKVLDLLRKLDFVRPVPVQTLMILKSAEFGGAVTPHQDATYLTTTPVSSVIGLWWALDDATKENGCMWAVPGSHLTVPVDERFVRDPSDPERAVLTVRKADYDLRGAVPMECKEGDLILLHGALVHFSGPNNSGLRRNAVALHVVESATSETTWTPENWLRSRIFRPSYGPSTGSDHAVTVIDLSWFSDPSDRRSSVRNAREWEEFRWRQNVEAAKFDHAMRGRGVAALVGHACTRRAQSRARTAALAFFGLPESTKQRFRAKAYGAAGFNPRGAEAVGSSGKEASGGAATVGDPVESVYVAGHGWEVLLDQLSRSDEQACRELCAAVRDYLEASRRVFESLSRLTSRALGLSDGDAGDEDFRVAAYGSAPMVQLKLSSYHLSEEREASRTEEVLYDAHTDYSGFTLLAVDPEDAAFPGGDGGMQFWSADAWRDVRLETPVVDVSNALIVNAGDLVPIWSGGRWKSPLHRVVRGKKRSSARMRVSLPCFTDPEPDRLALPLIRPVTEAERLYCERARAAPVTAGEWLKAKIEKTNVVLPKL